MSDHLSEQVSRQTRQRMEPTMSVHPSQDEQRYDVVVIGGGAAGLSGALTLGRARRSVLVIDAGEPRNAPADGVHNYLGREGTPPASYWPPAAGRCAGTAGRS